MIDILQAASVIVLAIITIHQTNQISDLKTIIRFHDDWIETFQDVTIHQTKRITAIEEGESWK